MAKSTSVASSTKISVSDISKHAKKIRKPNEAWTAAIKRAAAELKKG